MPYQKLGKIPQGKSSRQGPSFYGTGQDGDLSTTGNTDAPNSSTDDSSSCISQFNSLTVNSGHTLTLTGRRRAWVIYCVGDMNIQGSIVMNKGASSTASVINLTRYDVNGLTGTSCEPANTVNFTTPALSATGGAAASAGSNANNGSAGTNGQTGGGGSGAGGASTAAGAGATGTSYSGGSGGGAGGNGTASAGVTNGGSGGDASTSVNTNDSAGGGAGNPGGAGRSGAGSGVGSPGSTGTGGTLILIVGGNLTIGGSAVISANGSAGGNAINGGSFNNAGGGSGAGRVIVLYAGTLTNSGSIVATGGAGGTASGGTLNRGGGNGGAGSISGPTQVGR